MWVTEKQVCIFSYDIISIFSQHVGFPIWNNYKENGGVNLLRYAKELYVLKQSNIFINFYTNIID